MAAIGIDLGSSFARVAVSRDAVPELLVTDGSSMDLAAVVSVDGGDVVVGQRAVRRAITHPGRTVRRPKLLLGRAVSDPVLRQLQEAWTWSSAEDGKGLILDLDGQRRTVEELVAAVLSNLVARAREHTGDEPRFVAIGVPVWFGPAQREALERAVALAGIKEHMLVSEGLATALGLRLDDGPQRRVAIVDIGASASTVAVADAGNGAVDVLASSSSPTAGEEIDRGLTRVAFAQLKFASHGPELAELLRQTCEAMKRDLAAAPISRRQLPPLGPAAPRPTLTFDRTKLAGVLQPVILGLKPRILWACRDAKVSLESIEELYLVGGTCNSPIVAGGVERLFGKPATSAPFKVGAVARGAALFAQMHSPTHRSRPAAPPAGRAAPPPRPRAATPPPPAPPQAPDVRQARARPSTAPPPQAPEPEVLAPSWAPPPPPPEWDSGSRPPGPDSGSRPPGPPSIPPGRPSIPFSPAVFNAVPETIGSGRIVNPADMTELLAMPLNEPLSQVHVEAIALPVLLLRMIGKVSTTGTLKVTMDGEKPVLVPVEYGTATLRDTERAAVVRSFTQRTGTYDFSPSEPAPYSEPLGDTDIFLDMLRLVYDSLRAWLKGANAEDLRAALGDHERLCPIMSEKRRRIAARLKLPDQEARLVKKGFDGTRTSTEIVDKSGLNSRSALALLHSLAILHLVEWKEPEAKVERTLADEVRERATGLAHKDHFEALSVHWTAPLSEIVAAYEKLCELTSPEGAWHDAAPEACEQIRQRVDAAYEVLKAADSRMHYRLKIHGNVDFVALADLLSQKAKAASMRSDRDDYKQALDVLTEMIAASRRKRGLGKIEF